MSQQKQLIMDNKDFKWTDALIAKYGVFYHSAFSDVDKWISKDVLAEFKKSKQPKRDWQIVEWDMSGKHKNAKDVTNEAMIECGCKIKSVLRIPDGEVFSIGDRINYKGEERYPFWVNGDEFCTIDKFSLHNGDIFVNSHYAAKSLKTISDWYKAPEKPKPLLFEGKVTLEQYIDDPTFPCLFVPEQTGRNSERYLVWDEADLVECKIRGLGSYFKVSISKIDKQRPAALCCTDI